MLAGDLSSCFFRRLAALACTVLLLAGCSRDAPTPGPCPTVACIDGFASSVLADPEVARLDAASPYFDAAGCGSILLLEGWHSVEQHEGADLSYVWARGTVASIEVPTPLTASAGPLPDYVLSVHIGALVQTDRPQAVELFAGDLRLGRHRVDRHWSTVEFSVPPEVFESPWNEFRFQFDWAESPKSFGRSEDNRSLAAAVARIALRPKRTRSFPVARLQHQHGGQQTSLHLPPGSVVTWPMPRNADITVSLPASVAGGGDCGWNAALHSGDGVTYLSESETAEDTLHLRFDTGSNWSHLAVSWCPEGEHGTGDLTLQIPPDALSWEPSPSGRPEHGESAKAELPDLFFYLVDTLRADSLSIYAGQYPTPHLAELASDAVTYRQAWSASTWTLPATVSLLTGVLPSRHGVDTGQHKLGESSIPPLAERLRDMGYVTIGLSQSLVASHRFGVDRGFDHFRLDNQLGSYALRSHRLRTLFLRYLLSDPAAATRPLFVYLHSVDPHSPYRPDDGFDDWAGRLQGSLPRSQYNPNWFNLSRPRLPDHEVARLRALYDGEVAWSDQQLGRFLRLLEHLGLYEASLFAFTSDHGEEFGEHGGFDHGRTLYQEQLWVPLVVRFPGGVNGGTKVDRPVSTMDLAPTVLEMISSPASRESTDSALEGSNLSGRDLLAETDHEHAEPRWLLGEVHPVSTEHLREVDYVAFRRGDLKCIVSRLPHDQFAREIARWQVFDLASDPEEQSPLASQDQRVKECLAAWVKHQRELVPNKESGPATDRETLDDLRILGYIGKD